MARRTKSSANRQPESRELSATDLQKAFRNVQRRINELERFDVKTITDRSDPKAEALRNKINDTISDIFGHGTVEDWRYCIRQLGTLPFIVGSRNPSLSEVQEDYRKGIYNALTSLISLNETLMEKFQDANEISASYAKTTEVTTLANSRDVFIVHGHDDHAKLAVVNFIGKLQLNPLVLHEKPNEGRTIIEKFEDHADVAFAVVLMTPDDVGALAAEKDKLKSRARQNVILELGFFLGSLGRKRVCALYKENVEIPSDYKGVLFIPMDKNNAWQLSLAREIKAAGIEIDLNKAL